MGCEVRTVDQGGTQCVNNNTLCMDVVFDFCYQSLKIWIYVLPLQDTFIFSTQKLALLLFEKRCKNAFVWCSLGGK